MQFSDILILSGIVCGFITSIILVFTAKDINNRLLGISFFVLWWQALFYLLTATFLIYKVPYLYRVGAPFYCLIPPLNYLYVRNILNSRKTISRTDYWHFLLFVLALIDLMPYYVSDSSTKLALVNAVMKDVNNCYLIDTGFLPSSVPPIVRSVQGVIYSVFQAILLFRAKDTWRKNISQPVYIWLILLTIFFAILNSGMLTSGLIIYFNQGIGKPFFQLLELPKIYISITFLCACFCLFFFPKILYNLTPIELPEIHDFNSQAPVNQKNIPELVSDKSANQIKLKAPLSEHKLDEYVKRIEHLMEESQCFLKDITLNDMAKLLDINHRYLSFILNNHYQLSFPDFINSYRVRYVIKRIGLGDFKMLKLESIANDAGFTSRSTFYNAFKKYTGTTPSQYIKEF